MSKRDESDIFIQVAMWYAVLIGIVLILAFFGKEIWG